MKIHSSSLTSIPAGYKAKNRNDSPKTPADRKDNSADNTSVILPPQVIESKIDLASVQLISDSIDQQHIKPSNSRTAQALNAYIQENSQALKNQRSELVTGIDTFA